MKCPNKSHPDWIELVNLLGEPGAYKVYLENNEEVPDPKDFLNYVNYNLRLISALRSDKVRQPSKNIEGFYNDLTKAGVPKDQINLLQAFDLTNKTKQELIEQLAVNYSYSVEINIAKEYYEDEYQEESPFLSDEENANAPIIKYKREFDSQHYANLTVPGGTNYTENEIRTPGITPSIKGHAAFSTNEGIGWFRSDDQMIGGEPAENLLRRDGTIPKIDGDITKTRRILEVQSDLFQKGRDNKDLISNKEGYKEGELEMIDLKEKPSNDKQNQFLQLLNKDSSWVSFFIKSIVQDSAKKGYEKVLFPTGDTASKVEGHETLEEFKKQKEDRINRIKKMYSTQEKVEAQSLEEIEYYRSKNYIEGNLTKEGIEFTNPKKLTWGEVPLAVNEINQLEAELKRAETEGFGALKPIHTFYETVVTNTLNKIYGKESVTKITDEYGNTWNEVLTSTKDLILLDLPENTQSVYDDLIIPGFDAYLQYETVTHIAEQVIASIKETPGISFNQTISDFVAYAEDQILEGNTKYDPIVENIDRFRKLVKERLDKIGLLSSVPIDPNDSVEAEGDSLSDGFYWEDDWSFKYNSKANAQQQIKEFLSFIPKTVYEDGKFLDVENYLGTISYMPYDEVFEELKALLADVPNTWEAVRAELTKHQQAKPWIYNLLNLQVDGFEGDKKQLLNQFVSTFSSTYNNFKTIIWDDEKGTFVFKLIDTDQNSVVKNILTNWQYNFNTGGLFTFVDGKLAANKEKISLRIAELDSLKDHPNQVKSFLDSIGVEVKQGTITELIEGKVGGLTFAQHFTSDKGLFKITRSRLQGKDAKGLEEDEVINPVINNSAMRSLAYVEQQYNTQLYSNTTRNGEGNQVYSYSFNKFITYNFRKLQDPNYVANLSKLTFQAPIMNGSEPLYRTWLYEMANNPLFNDIFVASPFDTLKESSRNGTKLSRMTDIDIELAKWQAFQNKGRKVTGLGRVANYLFTVPSKTTAYLFTAPAIEVTTSKNNKLGKTAINALYNVALSELNRINSAREKTLTTNKYKNGSKYFFFFPVLNKETTPEIWNPDGSVKLPTTKVGEVTVESIIRKKIEDVIRQDIEAKLQYWNDIGFISGNQLLYLDESYNKGVEINNNAYLAAADYVINNSLFDFNLHQTFIGDPAIYFKGDVENTWEEIGKRLAAQIAPGKDLALQGDEKFISIKAKDREGNIALNIAQLQERIGAAVNPYFSLNGTDAQEFATWQETLFVKYRSGLLSTNQYEELTLLLTGGKPLNSKQLNLVINPDKPVYVNSEIDTTQDLLSLEYVKSSSIPLLPQFTKGLEIDKLRISMETLEFQKGIPVRLAFDSATKVGGIASINIFEENGDIKSNLDFSNNFKILDRAGFRIQQDVPYDPNKDEVTKSTQATKLLFDNLLKVKGFQFEGETYTGKKLKKLFNTLHKELFETAKAELGKEITAPGNHLDLTKVQKLLLDEATKREYSPAEIASLSILPNGQFEYPFWAISGSDRFEAILTSLWTNNIIRQPMPGNSYILVSEEGTKGRSEGVIYTDSYEGELKPMRIGENGEVLPAQVLVPWKFKGNISKYMKDGKIDNSKLPKELLEQFAFRIPNQGHNSMSLIEIVGFLPRIMGDAVIAPRNFITQMGSDFDIDKLYVYSYYTKEEDGKLVKDTLDSTNNLKNRIVDLHKAVLKNPEVFNSVVSPLGLGLLKYPDDSGKNVGVAVDLKKINKRQVNNYLNPDYKKQKYVESIDGKAMVGIESLASTLNTILQEADVYLITKDEEGRYVRDYIYFGDDKGKKLTLSGLSSPTTWRGRTKNSVISAGQSAAVDNEKDPILYYINSNPVTAPAIFALRQLGLEEDHVYNLTAQPLIREFVRRVRSVRSVVSDKKRVSEEDILNTLMGEAHAAYTKVIPSTQAQLIQGEAHIHLLTVEELKANLIKPTPKINYIAITKFAEAYRAGVSLMQIQSAINIESGGVGKSLVEVSNKTDKVDRLIKIQNLMNVSQLIDDTYTDHLITNSLLNANRVLNNPNDIFKYNSRTFRTILSEFETLTGTEPSVDQTKDLWNNYKSFIFAKDLAKTKRESLFFGANSLAKRIKAFMKTKEGRTNDFLVRLTLELQANPKRPDLISYNASKEEYVDETNIYRSFLELLTSNNPTTKQIGEDLVTYFYVNGGIQKAREWGKYIHPVYLKEYLGGTFLDNLKKVNFQEEETMGKGNVNSKFTEQYFRHKPWLLPQIKTDSKNYKVEGTSLTLTPPYEATGALPVSLTEEGEYPSMVVLKTEKETQIYLRNTGSEYSRVSQLGSKNFTEYQADDSLVNKNFRVSTKTTAPIKNAPKNDAKVVANDEADYTGPVNEVLDRIKTAKWQPLIELLQSQKYDFNIVLNTNLTDIAGRYSVEWHEEKIEINPNLSKDIEKTLVHEVVHAATALTIHGEIETTDSQKTATANLKVIFNSLVKRLEKGEFDNGTSINSQEFEEFKVLLANKNLSQVERQRRGELRPKYYGFVNIDEFLAELFTQQQFQEVLNNIKYDGKKSILDRLVELIAKVLIGFNAKAGSAFEASLREAVIIIADKEGDSEVSTEHNPLVTNDIEDAVPSNYKKLVDRFEDRLRFIDQSISKAIIEKDKARVELLIARKEEVEKELKSFEDNALFEGVEILAKKDLDLVRKILKQKALSHNDINYTLRVLKTWTEASDLVLTEQDILDENTLSKSVFAIEKDAAELYKKWYILARTSLLDAVKIESGLTNITKEVLEAQEKINALTANLMDISRTGNILLSVMDKWMRESIKRSNLEAKEIHDETFKLIADLEKNPLFKKEGYYLFAQKTNQGELTGELVRGLRHSYHQVRNDLLEKASKEKDKTTRASYWKNYFKWMKDNHTFFDVKKLFQLQGDGSYVYKPDTNYLDGLKKQFGENFDSLLEEQKQKIEFYNERLEYKKQSLDKEDPNSDREVEKWKIKYDPTIYLNGILNSSYTKTIVDGEFIRNEGHEFVVKRANKEWEDHQYNKIQDNPELKAFYTHMVETLNRLYSFIPAGFKEGITSSTIPSIPRTVTEVYNEEGMPAAITQANNQFIEGISVSDIEAETKKLQDPLTKKPEQTLFVRYLSNLSPEEKSYDLGKVINLFAKEALAFKHKSTVEDSIRLAKSILDQSLEVVRSPRGDQMINRFGETVKIKDSKYLMDQVEYAMQAWYGNRKDTQAVTRKKVYTNKAKSKVDNLSKELETISIEKIKDKKNVAFHKELEVAYPVLMEMPDGYKLAMIQYLKDNTRYIAGSKVGDAVIQYMQLKGMGWNIFGSVTNVVFGWFSNYAYAAGGVDFNTENLLKANRIMLSATGKGIGLESDTAKKINSLMVRYDVLKELNDASYRASTNTNRAKRGMENLSPFELQRRGEYFVQGMTMVASMLNQKVLVNGVETSLWDAYDVNGKFLGENKLDWEGPIEDRTANKEYFKFSNKLDQVNKAIHGNYDTNSPVRIKKGILGRALMQFRSWIAEGFANRVEGEKYDLLLGRKRKGRWRTYGDLGFKESFKSLFNIAAGRKLNQDEVTVQNMKRNLAELYQTLTLLALYFVLKEIDLDDDDEWGKKASNFTLNQILRLQDDIEFYYSPIAIDNITQNAVPVFTLVRDTNKFVDALQKGIVDGDWDYKTGKKSGQSRVLWTGAKIFPFGSSIASFINKTENEEGFRK